MKQELFNYLKGEHDVTLLDTDIEAIIRIVNQSSSMGQLIKPLIWDNEPKVSHVHKCVSVSYVDLPVQGNWKSHIAICNENDYGFKATLWLMNGGYGITDNCYCRTIDEAKIKAEEWWVNFVSVFLNCPSTRNRKTELKTTILWKKNFSTTNTKQY